MIHINKRLGQIQPLNIQEIITYNSMGVHMNHFKCIAFFHKEEQKYLTIIECQADNFQEGYFDTEKEVKVFAETLKSIGVTRFELIL
ncbi:hypothetical protein ABEX38_30030 [Priestia megaterium]